MVQASPSKKRRRSPSSSPGATPPLRRSGTATGVGGVALHFDVRGEGEPAIVCCNGVGVSTFFWKYVAEYFGAYRRVVTWDYRGHNGSGMPAELEPANFTMEINAQDCIAVLDAAGVDKAVFLGHSMGCQVIFEIWHQFPERVAGLVPVCGPYGRPLDTVPGSPALAQGVFDAFYMAVNSYPELSQAVLRPLLRSALPMQIARLGVINAQLAAVDDMQPYFDHLSQMELRVFFLMAGEMQNHNAESWLGDIDVPTLVVAGESDLMTPMSLSHRMQEKIPGAELLVLPKGSHAGLIEHPELLNLRLHKFLCERVLVESPSKKSPSKKKAKVRKSDRTKK